MIRSAEGERSKGGANGEPTRPCDGIGSRTNTKPRNTAAGTLRPTLLDERDFPSD